MSRVRVEYDSYGYRVEEPSEDYQNGEEYSYRGHTSASISVRGIQEVENSRDYCDLTTKFTIEPGRDYYLLYVVFETGDSFGTDGGNVEWIALYEDRDLAEEQVVNIRKNDENKDSYSVKLKLHDDVEIDYYAPWKGYFERIEDVVVEKVRM